MPFDPSPSEAAELGASLDEIEGRDHRQAYRDFLLEIDEEDFLGLLEEDEEDEEHDDD